MERKSQRKGLQRCTTQENIHKLHKGMGGLRTKKIRLKFNKDWLNIYLCKAAHGCWIKAFFLVMQQTNVYGAPWRHHWQVHWEQQQLGRLNKTYPGSFAFPDKLGVSVALHLKKNGWTVPGKGPNCSPVLPIMSERYSKLGSPVWSKERHHKSGPGVTQL